MYPAEAFESEQFEFAFEGEMESPFTEAEEMELALELLEVTNEAEMDYFLGNVFKKIGRGIKKIAKPLGGILKGIAKKALPFVGGALGSFIPIPGVGTAIGRAVGTAASNLFEMELEGLSHEEQELEVARRFVRFAGASARRAAASPSTVSPYAAARRGVTQAARRFVPGLYRRRPRGPRAIRPRPGIYDPSPGVEPSAINGRWIRRGHNIVIPNCYGGPPSNGSGSPEPYPEPQGDEGDEGAE